MMQGNPMLSLIWIPVISRCALAILAGKPLSHSQYSEKEEMKAQRKDCSDKPYGIGNFGLGSGSWRGMPLEPTYGVF